MNPKSSLNHRIIGVLTSILLSTLIFIQVFMYFAFDADFYVKHFLDLKVHETVGVSEADLTIVTNELVHYIDNNTGDLHVMATVAGVYMEYFNPKEQAHLNDIKLLIRSTRVVLNGIHILLGALLFIYLIWGFRKKYKLTPILKNTVITSFIWLIILVILYFSDFDWAFRKFHEILFYNDLWLLNPHSDRLLQMMPIEFFMIFTVYFLITVFAINSILLLAYLIFERKKRKKGRLFI